MTGGPFSELAHIVGEACVAFSAAGRGAGAETWRVVRGFGAAVGEIAVRRGSSRKVEDEE